MRLKILLTVIPTLFASITFAEELVQQKQIIFYNGEVDRYIKSITGICETRSFPTLFRVRCEIGPEIYRRHELAVTGNITYIIQDGDFVTPGSYPYEVKINPEIGVPQ